MISQCAKIILGKYPTISKLCTTVAERGQFTKDNKSKNIVYILICNNEIIALGEGTIERSNVIYPGRSAPAHLKALACATATNLAKSRNQEIERIIIAAQNKEHASLIEHELFDLFPIKELSVDSKNLDLYAARLEDMERVKSIAQNLDEKISISRRDMYTILLQPILKATGTDMGTFKKNMDTYESFVPGFKDYMRIYFGGYYTDP